jgi:hypothetical protein
MVVAPLDVIDLLGRTRTPFAVLDHRAAATIPRLDPAGDLRPVGW